MSIISTYDDAEKYLYQFMNLEKKITPYTKREYRLDRMETFLELIGNPHRDARCIHIAGSKGKGSTAVFCAELLEKHGFSTGLYTSPHTIFLRERIQLRRKPVMESVFISLVDHIAKVLDLHQSSDFPGDMQPTFFEIMTCIGFLAFRQADCDYWVLETGLGGRLDATNIVLPLVSVITPIEFEHEDILGDTLEKIAMEKCGIIKEAIPVVSSRQRDEVKSIIQETARSRNTTEEFFDDFTGSVQVVVTPSGTRFSCKYNGKLVEYELRMLGLHQVENAMLAYHIVCLLGIEPDSRAVSAAFRSAVLPARLEVLRQDPLFLIDGAHTPESVKRAADVIVKISNGPRILLFASILGKKYKAMADILAPLFSEIYVSTPGNIRKSNPGEVYQYFRTLHDNVHFVKTPREAFERIIDTDIPVCVLGSFYFAAEIRRYHFMVC